jgi:hypothetical protein
MFTNQATTTALAISGWFIAVTTIALYYRTQRKQKLVDPQEPLPSVNNSSRPDPYSAAPRSNFLSWDDYFMSIAFLSAQRSKDPSKQVWRAAGTQAPTCHMGSYHFSRSQLNMSPDQLQWLVVSRMACCLDLMSSWLKQGLPYTPHLHIHAHATCTSAHTVSCDGAGGGLHRQ